MFSQDSTPNDEIPRCFEPDSYVVTDRHPLKTYRPKPHEAMSQHANVHARYVWMESSVQVCSLRFSQRV